MSYTLGQVTHKVASVLQILSEGRATGGGVTSIVDTSLRTEADDYWNGGSAWVWYDAGGLAADPEYSFSVISDFDNASSTLTLRDTLPDAVASGDKYSICRKIGKDTWLDVIIQKVNDALRDIGPIPQVDITTITMAAAQTEYTLPIRSAQDLRQVFIQRVTTDADNNMWTELVNYDITHGTPGNAPTIRLPMQYSSGHDLMLVYMDYHPEMQINADVLSDHIPIDRVVYPAALACLYWRKELNTGSDRWDSVIGRIEAKVTEVATMYPIHKPTRAGRVNLIAWGTNEPTRYPFEANKVYLR